jgi:hypothetical protein
VGPLHPDGYPVTAVAAVCDARQGILWHEPVVPRCRTGRRRSPTPMAWYQLRRSRDTRRLRRIAPEVGRRWTIQPSWPSGHDLDDGPGPVLVRWRRPAPQALRTYGTETSTYSKTRPLETSRSSCGGGCILPTRFTARVPDPGWDRSHRHGGHREIAGGRSLPRQPLRSDTERGRHPSCSATTPTSPGPTRPRRIGGPTRADGHEADEPRAPTCQSTPRGDRHRRLEGRSNKSVRRSGAVHLNHRVPREPMFHVEHDQR